MKKYIVLLCSLFVFAAANSQDLAKANKSFEEGLFKQAITDFAPFLDSKNSDIRYEAQLKTALAYSYAFEFNNALKAIFNTPVPSGDLWKARYYIVRAQIFQNALFYNAQDFKESETDPTRFTVAQRRDVVEKSHKALWSMRKSLIDMPTAESLPFIQRFYRGTAGLVLTPTLFDHMMETWLAAGVAPKDTVFEQAFVLGGKDRDAVREYWQIRRINETLKPEPKDNLPTANLLMVISGFTPVDSAHDLLVTKVKDPLFFKAQEIIGKAFAAQSAASIFAGAENPGKAVELLDYCLALPLNFFTDSCKNIKDGITAESLNIAEAPQFNVPLNKPAVIKVTSANIEKVYMHLYNIGPEYFDNNYPNSKNNTPSWNSRPNWLAQQDILDLKPTRTLVLGFKYAQRYVPITSEVEIPFTTKGFYAVVLSKTEKPREEDRMIFLNFTDIAGYATSFSLTNSFNTQKYLGGAFHIYSIDPLSGLIKPYVTLHAGGKKLSTDKNGLLRVNAAKNKEYDSLSVLMQREGSYGIIPRIVYNKNAESPYSIVLNTDRAIYRPGQEVKIKANVIERKVLDYAAYSGKEKLTLALRTPNWQQTAAITLPLDDMGGAEHTFTLPQEGMLGNYTITATLGRNTVSSSHSISVEEFKRPEFEVNLNAFEGIASYGRPLALQGTAMALNGLPVANARVAYTINQSYFTPWFCWWWQPFSGSRQDAIEGTVKTDKNGNFKIVFTPEQAKDTLPEFIGRPSRFTVNVFVTDEGGRTLKASRTYTVSGQEYFFSMKMEKGFFRAGTENNHLMVTMVNADEKPLAGKAGAHIYSAKIDETAQDATPLSLLRILPPHDNMPQLKEDKLIDTIQVTFSAAGASKIVLPKLDEGYYILKLIARDSNGKDNEGRLSFMAVDTENPSIILPAGITVAEYQEYYPGEKALILLGASEALGPKYVEIYKDRFLMDTKTLVKQGPVMLELPIAAHHRGGVNLNWFSIYNYKSFTGNLTIGVATRNTKLNINAVMPETVEPGQEVKAALDIKDENGLGINGQALVTVYDKSLDYYRAHSLNLPAVFNAKRFTDNPISSSFAQDFIFFGNPMIRAATSRMGGMPSNNVALGAMVKSAAPKADAVMFESAVAFDAGAGGEGEASSSAVQIRQNFAETAFWNPSLKIERGAAAFSFKAPERITKWAVLAAAFTKDMKTGKKDITFATRKDLMIRLEAPRFLREGDKLALTAIVANDTDNDLTAEVSLTPQLDGADAAALLGIKQLKQTVTIPARRQLPVSWALKAPEGMGMFTFTAVARAGELSDGELKTFPLLPSAQRLAQSSTVAIEKEVTAISLDIDKGAALEAVHLTVDPSLLMPVINTIPFITYSNFETVSSLVNSYLPLAIMNSMYNKYPYLREAVSKLPKRETVTPPWEVNENMLLRDLASSPWFTLSKGFETQLSTINIFDAALVKKMEAETLKKLSAFQNKDGGFAWVKGGRSNIFMTLLVAENMASARRHGVEVPEAMVKNALKYLTANIELETKQPSHANISSALYMAYVLTSFPESWYDYDVKALMKTANDYANYMTPLGRTYAAAVFNRLGEEKAAQAYIKRLFDNAKENEVTGIYFAPEEFSWLWFNDNMNLHTAVIKVLTEINPDDQRIPKLVKWLMFSRKATMWGSSEQAAKAVYTLLDVIAKKPDFGGGKTFKVLWGGEEHSVQVKPYDLNAKISLSKHGAQANKNFLKATVIRKVDDATQNSALPDFASLSALYTTKTPKQPAKGLMNVNKQFFLIQDKGAKALKNGATVNVGDEILVRLTISTGNAFDFVLIDDPKPAAFEADALLSGWRFDTLSRYEEIRDSKTNFFMDRLPNGTYELNYTLRPTTPGTYTVGAAQMQSMFAPEFSTHSAGFTINVK